MAWLGTNPPPAVASDDDAGGDQVDAVGERLVVAAAEVSMMGCRRGAIENLSCFYGTKAREMLSCCFACLLTAIVLLALRRTSAPQG
jgi:hypothetical protein